MMHSHSPIVTDSGVTTCRRCTPPGPHAITTTSLLTFLGAVEALGPGDCSRNPSFYERCEIAILQLEIVGPSHTQHPAAQANTSARPRGFL